MGSRLRLRARIPVTPIPGPSLISPPTIASSDPGNYEVGNQLVVTPGTYGNGATVTGYAWYRSDDSLIATDGTDTYTLTVGDIDFSVYAIEIASNAGGVLQTATSELGPVVAAPDPNPYTIDDAQAEIEAGFADQWAGLASNTVWDTDTTVTTPAALQTALTACFSTASGSIAITRKHRIVCDWNGTLTATSGATNIQARGYSSTSRPAGDGHSDNGGGIYVVAATGKTPAIGNMLDVLGVRGIHVRGLGFAKEWTGSGAQETQFGAQCRLNSSFPAKPIAIFEDCTFGVAYHNGAAADTQWIGGMTVSSAADWIYLKNCSGAGFENGFKIISRFTKIEGCDFQLVKQDYCDYFGHLSTGYYAYVWVKDTTFRNPADNVANRNAHQDMGQTGGGADQHLGYRVLWEDVVGHANHSYAGDPGQGGGTQGSYNDDYPSADNQFVLRRTFILVNSPSAFAFYSPMPTRVSFVDRCTFTRCGMVPSGLPGDVNAAQDFAIGLYGGSSTSVGGPWIYATNNIQGIDVAARGYDWYSMSGNIYCDPRNTSIVTNAADRPENIFVGGGPGFVRDEYTAGKLSYHLAGEENGRTYTVSSRTKAQFKADVWAMFEPLPAYAGKGAPQPA
jgi:hypothetical protein